MVQRITTVFNIVLAYLTTRVKSRENKLVFTKKMLSQIWGVKRAEMIMPLVEKATVGVE